MYRDGVIVAIVRFPIDPALPADDVRAMFEASAPSYQKLPGLLRKHYLRAEDGASAGGVYLWESRAAAEAVYDAAWRNRLTDRYGAPPMVEYFESPVTVDPERITVE
jgi:heme-degrading monooxygenase HmoA